MSRIIRGMLIISALLAVALPISVGPAAAKGSAGVHPDHCPIGWGCFWENADYSGTTAAWNGFDDSWPASIRNDDEAGYNRAAASSPLRSYTGDGFSGTVIVCLPRDWPPVSPVSPLNNGQSHQWVGPSCSNPGG